VDSFAEGQLISGIGTVFTLNSGESE